MQRCLYQVAIRASIAEVENTSVPFAIFVANYSDKIYSTDTP